MDAAQRPYAILVNILWLIPNTIESLIPAARDINPVLATGLGIVAFVLVITVVIVAVRRAILFPAIAIDAPSATWSKARLVRREAPGAWPSYSS